MGEMRILNTEGDLKVIWDPNNEDEVQAAEEQFDSLKEKGYNAYSVKKNGRKNVMIDEFDPEAGKIIMTPAIVGG